MLRTYCPNILWSYIIGSYSQSILCWSQFISTFFQHREVKKFFLIIVSKVSFLCCSISFWQLDHHEKSYFFFQMKLFAKRKFNKNNQNPYITSMDILKLGRNGILLFNVPIHITKYFKNEWMILKIFQIRRLLCILKALSIGCENRQIWI